MSDESDALKAALASVAEGEGRIAAPRLRDGVASLVLEVGGLSAERIVRLIEQISRIGGDEVEIRLRSPDVGLPITSLALYTPPPPKAPPERTRFKVPKPDPYLRAYVQATTEFDRMVRVSDQKLLEFARRQMQGRDVVLSSEIAIESIPDLFAYRALPNLAAVGRSVRLGEFTITIEERFGRISENMIRRWPAPCARAASTNSFSRSDSTWPRIGLAM